MKKIKFLLILALILKSAILPNGMRVFIFPSQEYNMVQISVLFTCGKVDEPKPGTFNLLYYYFISKNFDKLRKNPIDLSFELGLDYALLKATAPTKYWAVTMDFFKELLTQKKIEMAHVSRAKRLLLMNFPKQDYTDFAPYLFYVGSDYASLFPDPREINTISQADLQQLKDNCIIPKHTILIYEGSFIEEILQQKYIKPLTLWLKPKLYFPPPPPDVPGLSYGFVEDNSAAYLIWFFKIIDPSDVFPILSFLTLEGISPGGILFNELREKRGIASNVEFGIKRNRRVSFGFLKIETSSRYLPVVFQISRKLIFQKLKEGIKKNEFKRLQKYYRGVMSIKKSYPWQQTEEVIDTILMKIYWKTSLKEINFSLSNVNRRSISTLFVGNSSVINNVVKITEELSVLSKRGEFLYTINKEK